MKISKKMSIGELAAFVASYLESKGISTVLTGGAVVSNSRWLLLKEINI
jgi:hypothetical protein